MSARSSAGSPTRPVELPYSLLKKSARPRQAQVQAPEGRRTEASLGKHSRRPRRGLATRRRQHFGLALRVRAAVSRLWRCLDSGGRSARPLWSFAPCIRPAGLVTLPAGTCSTGCYVSTPRMDHSAALELLSWRSTIRPYISGRRSLKRSMMCLSGTRTRRLERASATSISA